MLSFCQNFNQFSMLFQINLIFFIIDFLNVYKGFRAFIGNFNLPLVKLNLFYSIIIHYLCVVKHDKKQ